MATVEQKMEEFQSKSYKERFKMSMDIITNLKDRGNTQAKEIFDIISGMDKDKIPDKLLNAIYKDFCDSIELAEKEKEQKIQQEVNSFDKSINNVAMIKEKEAAYERTLIDPDDILE